jgi:16S rRNA (cytosine1402-N4)-methyltransferase
MDHRSELTAAVVLQTYTEAKLHLLFERYGELRNAKQLAKHIATQRPKAAITTTQDLKAFLEPVIKGNPQRYLAQLFQALRIEVNDELAVLERAIPAALDCLALDGRIVVLSYHSLEDRIVKNALRIGTESKTPIEMPFVPESDKPWLQLLTRGSESASDDEITENSRATSVRLRAAQRIGVAA